MAWPIDNDPNETLGTNSWTWNNPFSHSDSRKTYSKSWCVLSRSENCIVEQLKSRNNQIRSMIPWFYRLDKKPKPQIWLAKDHVLKTNRNQSCFPISFPRQKAANTAPITLPLKPLSSRYSTPVIVVPPGEQTWSFNSATIQPKTKPIPGCLWVLITISADPRTI